jgi:transposase-like protein
VINLVEERLRRGRSVAQASAEIGVPDHVLRYAEKGGRPLPENALKIANYYGVDVVAQWPLESEAA